MNVTQLQIEGAKIAYGISQTPTMQTLKTKLHPGAIPGCEKWPLLSDEYLECQARHHTLTIFHPVGTCKMGPASDLTAVVDSRLKVCFLMSTIFNQSYLKKKIKLIGLRRGRTESGGCKYHA